MAKPLPKKHAWDKVRFRSGPNYFEASERKLVENIAAVLLIFGPIAGFLWFYIATRGTIDSLGVAMVGVVLSIPVLATLILYRPPRVIRVYPDEAVAQTSRGLFGKQLWVRWHDLSRSLLKVERTRVITGQSASGGAVAVGCLLSLLGPLGLIAMLASGLASGKKEYATAFALIDDRRPARPLAVFLKRSDAQKLVTISSSIGLDTVGTSGSP